MTEVNKDSVGLSWDKSLNDGGCPITSYVIEKRDASRNNWIGILHTTPETTRTVVPKLWEGCDYFFRVAAENSVGLSDYVELDKPVTIKAPFSEFFDLQSCSFCFPWHSFLDIVRMQWRCQDSGIWGEDTVTRKKVVNKFLAHSCILFRSFYQPQPPISQALHKSHDWS